MASNFLVGTEVLAHLRCLPNLSTLLSMLPSNSILADRYYGYARSKFLDWLNKLRKFWSSLWGQFTKENNVPANIWGREVGWIYFQHTNKAVAFHARWNFDWFFELKKIKISKGRCGNVKAILRKKKKNHPRDNSKKASFIQFVTGHSKLFKMLIKLARFNFTSIALRSSASSRPTFNVPIMSEPVLYWPTESLIRSLDI